MSLRTKREEKMAAAAAAREAAERERRAALQAAERGRLEKQAHAHHGRQERLREVERKKLELARKTAETEERRKAEEQARLARLADEQRRAEAARRKHAEETEAMKREAAIMAKEIEKRQKEYMEKQKIKRVESGMYSTPLKYPIMVGGSSPEAVEPAYMADGFEFLNSDEEAEPVSRPVPAWCASKAFGAQLRAQAALDPVLTDRLFGVRPRTVDLRAVFPALDRRQLKRTSSAVWRTPPGQEQHRC